MTTLRRALLMIAMLAAGLTWQVEPVQAMRYVGVDGSLGEDMNCFCTPDDKAVADSLGTCLIRDYVMAGHTDTAEQCESRCKNDENDNWQTPSKWTESNFCALQIGQCADVGDGRCTRYSGCESSLCKSKYFCEPNDPSLCRQPCYCRYPSNYYMATCRGKTTIVPPPTGQTGTPAECASVCPAKIEGSVSVTANEANQCSFYPTDEECNKLFGVTDLQKIEKEGKIDYNRFGHGRCYNATPWCYCRYPGDFHIENCQTLPRFTGLVQEPNAEQWCRDYCGALKHGGKEPFTFYKISRSGDKFDVCYYDDANRCGSPVQGINHPACQNPEFLKELTDKRTNDELARIQEFEQKYANIQGSTVSLPLPLGAKSPQAAVGRIIKQIFGVVGGLALGTFVFAGFLWMTAAGNPDKVKKAKATVVWASIGLVFLFAAYALVNFVITSLA